jgi:hypothetical protein
MNHKGNPKHGFNSKAWKSQHPLEHRIYSVWEAMRKRCRGTTEQTKRNYKDRGIVVCERWDHFENFMSDMGPSWKLGLTIDRINNEAGYNPDNCRWVTRKEQNRNTRKNVWLNLKGQKLLLTDWSKVTGISQKYVSQLVKERCATHQQVADSLMARA